MDQPERPADPLLHELRAMPAGGRWYVIIIATLAGVGCAFVAIALAAEAETWIGRGVALFILEPIALACLLAVITIVSPDSVFAHFFAGALRRASIVVGLLLFSFVAGMLGLLGWALWAYLTDR